MTKEYLEREIERLRFEIEFFDFNKTKKEQKEVLKKMFELIDSITNEVHKVKYY